MRVTGTITQYDVRNLDPSGLQAKLDKLKADLRNDHGNGHFVTTTEPNGDIAWTYDYDPLSLDGDSDDENAPPAFELTDAEISAIDHAKVFVANSTQIKQNPETGLYEALNEEALAADPGMASRIETLNVLVSLLARVHS